MIQFDLEKSRKARISFENVPELELPDKKSSEICIVTKGNVFDTSRSFAIELALPANSSYYVALGARYIPTKEYNGLVVEARYTDDILENYNTALAYSKRTVYRGLPREYVDTILETTRDYLGTAIIPVGKILFDSAAYCEVGTSPLMFRIATKIVLSVLLGERYPISDDEIRRICEKHLAERVKPIGEKQRPAWQV
jgi:hypothetical protein